MPNNGIARRVRKYNTIKKSKIRTPLKTAMEGFFVLNRFAISFGNYVFDGPEPNE